MHPQQRLLLEYEKRQQLEGPGPVPALPGPSGYDTGITGIDDDGTAGAIIDAEEARRSRLLSQERTGACDHVAAGLDAAFAHGMCRNCFEEFITIAGDEQVWWRVYILHGTLPYAMTRVMTQPSLHTRAQSVRNRICMQVIGTCNNGCNCDCKTSS